MVLTPGFVGVLILTLLLELLVPARPRPGWSSASVRQDVAWFFYEGILHALVLTTYVAALRWAYLRVFHPLSIPGLSTSSEGTRFLVGLLLTDFCMWAQHRLHHAVPWLWQLHAVHHSQKELSFFTDFRYHVLEYVVRETVLAIPLVMLGVVVPDIVAFSVFRRWYSRFYHGNIRTDLGPLRYVLVTPQSHRVHHALEPRLQNRNFGALFSIWDFLFGTQYKGWDEYPETGIDDDAFPHETEGDAASVLVGPIRQTLYPLGRIARR
jgi:sterol desaturase/sphingolipid hydroxylase (fatty acid hydroxylase superfamily)